MKILIIEDELLIARSISILIKKRGFEVDISTTGIQAIDLIKTNDYKKILMDLMLTDITGFDILESVKSLYSKEEFIKTFHIMTAYSSPEILHKVNEYELKFFRKPFDNIQSTLELILK